MRDRNEFDCAVTEERDRLPLFSICIPAYNSQDTIARCLGSIACQTFTDYEVVVVDDGSDVPLELSVGALGGLDGSRARLIRQDNQGTYAARQTAIKAARGRYVWCVDSDDRLASPDALKMLVMAMESSSNPDIVFFKIRRENGTYMFDYSRLGTSGPISKRSATGFYSKHPFWNSLCCLVFRRELLDAFPKRPRLVMAEDGLLKAEILARAETFVLLDEPLYLYHQNPGSKLNSLFEVSDFNDRVYVACQVHGMLGPLGISEEQWAALYCWYLSSSAYEVAKDPRRGRPERLRLYEQFCQAELCDLALSYEHVDLPQRDLVCLEACRDGKWGRLDVILKARHLASELKQALRR